jgi:hypothetical protein
MPGSGQTGLELSRGAPRSGACGALDRSGALLGKGFRAGSARQGRRQVLEQINPVRKLVAKNGECPRFSGSEKRHPDDGQDPVSNSTRIELAPHFKALPHDELGPDRRQGDDNLELCGWISRGFTPKPTHHLPPEERSEFRGKVVMYLLKKYPPRAASETSRFSTSQHRRS